MSKTLGQLIREESLSAVAEMGGSYDEFVFWNQILALFGLEPII